MSYPLWTCDIDKSHAGQSMQQVMSYLDNHKTDYTPKIIELSDFQKWFLDTGLPVTLLFRWDNYKTISPADDYTKKFLDLIYTVLNTREDYPKPGQWRTYVESYLYNMVILGPDALDHIDNIISLYRDNPTLSYF